MAGRLLQAEGWRLVVDRIRDPKREAEAARLALRQAIGPDLDLLDSVYDSAERILTGGWVRISKPRGLNPALLYLTMALLTKACKTTRAVRVVAVEGCGEDALVLTRSLFETTMAVLWILQRDSRRRAELYVAHRTVRLLIQLREIKITPGQKRFVSKATIAALENTVKEYERVLGAPAVKSARKHWAGDKGLEGVARAVGGKRGWRRAYNSLYRLASVHAHASDGQSHIDELGEGGIPVVKLLPGDAAVRESLYTATCLLLATVERIDARCGLQKSDEIQALNQQVHSGRSNVLRPRI